MSQLGGQGSSEDGHSSTELGLDNAGIGVLESWPSTVQIQGGWVSLAVTCVLCAACTDRGASKFCVRGSQLTGILQLVDRRPAAAQKQSLLPACTQESCPLLAYAAARGPSRLCLLPWADQPPLCHTSVPLRQLAQAGPDVPILAHTERHHLCPPCYVACDPGCRHPSALRSYNLATAFPLVAWPAHTASFPGWALRHPPIQKCQVWEMLPPRLSKYCRPGPWPPVASGGVTALLALTRCPAPPSCQSLQKSPFQWTAELAGAHESCSLGSVTSLPCPLCYWVKGSSAWALLMG